MKRLLRHIPVLGLLPLLFLGAFAAPSGSIESIEVQGLFRMSREAFLHAFGVEVGESYDEERIRLRFKALWDLRLFEDITIEAETGTAGGAVVIVKVKERPVLTAVSYQDASSVTRTEIEDRLKERNFSLQLGKPLDLGLVYFAESEIRDILAQKGFLDAKVEAEVRKVTETSRAVHFFISSGGKTRILKISFSGNEKYSDRKLKSGLNITAQRKWYWPWSGKNLYHPAKWDQDVSGVRDLYLADGYLDVEIRPPVVELRQTAKDRKRAERARAQSEQARFETVPSDEDTDSMTPKQLERRAKKQFKQEEQARKKTRKAQKVKRWVYLTVPIDEGPQYTLGQVTFTGNKKFESDVLRKFIQVQEGDILRNNMVDTGVQQLGLLYENLGHLYATVVRRIQRREDGFIADLEISIEEDEPYYIARIEFQGNTSTHDRVLRREMLLSEGEVFSRTKLDISRIKVNQLGYVQVPTEPVIEPVEGENRVNVNVGVLEQGRNEIQVGGGFSGVDGAFFNGVYSTRNFLGRGQVLSTAIQIGGRSNRYQISFQEPWFLNRPYRLGFSIFRRDQDFGSSLKSSSEGGGVLLGKRVGRFSQISLGYNWESVESRTVLQSTALDATTITTTNKVSSLTPVYSFDRINDPYRPTGGSRLTASLQIAGGPLGGNTSFLKPIINFTGYKRANTKSFFALHAQLGLVREWQGGSDPNTSSIEGVPRYLRFWLGGDTLGPRVFETRSITPLRYVKLDARGRIKEVLGDPRFTSPQNFVTSGGVPVVIEAGGDRFFLLQTEWVFPFNEQAEVALFMDAGDTLFEDQSWGFDTTRVSAGVELRFHLPIFPVPLRLIYGVPVRKLEGDDTGSFTFSIGRSF